MIIAGVDEAGRGSVLGPMVVAGVRISSSKLKVLSSLGVTDSKKLTPDNRERLYRQILRVVDDYCVKIVKPSSIDQYVAINGLNSLEALSMAAVIEKLRPRIAYVDSCDVDPKRFAETIGSCLKRKVRIESMHHADSLHVAVSAASIVAKVRRDREFQKIRKKIGLVGSGYPSDRLTMEFVNKWIFQHKKAPQFARHSWKPVRELVAEYQQRKISEF